MNAVDVATVGWLSASLLAGLIGAGLGAALIRRRRTDR